MQFFQNSSGQHYISGKGRLYNQKFKHLPAKLQLYSLLEGFNNKKIRILIFWC